MSPSCDIIYKVVNNNNEINDNNTINYINRVMKTLVYERILAQKQLYFDKH